jgi:hypothetical protein
MPAIKGQKPHRGKTVTVAEFRRMWHDPDLTVDDIARALNVCRRSVWQRARHRGMPDRTTIIKPGPKPTLDAAAEAMWRACVRGEDIAAIYGVSLSTIHMHVHRKSIERGRQVDRWHPAITLADYRAAQLRNAMAASANSEQAAAREYWRAA